MPYARPADFDHRSVFVGTVYLMIGNIAGQAISLLGLLIISRIYAPADVGLWAMFLGIGFMVPLLAGFRYDLAAIIVDEDRDSGLLVALTMLLAVVCALLVAVMAGVFWVFDPGWLPETWKLIVFAYAPYILSNGALNAAASWAVRKKHFRWLMFIRLGQPLITLILQYLFVTSHMLGNGLVFGTVVGCIVLALPCLKLIIAPIRESTRSMSFADFWQALKIVARREKSFPLFSVPYAVIGNFASQAVVIAMGAWYSMTLVGHFNMAFRTLYAPMILISSALGQAIMPVLAGAKNDIKRYQDALVGIMRLLGWIHIPPLVFIIVYGPDVYGLVFGKQWQGAGFYAAFLTMSVFGSALTLWLERIFDILGRQKLHLLVSAILNSGILIFFSAAHILSDDPVVTIATWSASTLVYAIIWITVVFKICHFDLRALVRLGAELTVAAALTIFLTLEAIKQPRFAIEIIQIAGLYTAYGFAAWLCLRKDFGRMFAWRHKPQE